MNLTAVTITKNEAKVIERCIKSTKDLVVEHIVIDSGSTDDTVKLAKNAGAKVISHEWLGYGPQKNIGLKEAASEWVLFIDADEEVTPELALEIRKIKSNAEVNFFWLRIVTVFLGKPLKHLYGHNPRLFKRTAGRWTDAAVHEQVETSEGQQIRLGDNYSRVLTEPLLHHSHATVKSYLSKMHKYTELDAQQMLLTGNHRSGKKIYVFRLLPWYLSLRQFIKLLLYRGGWHDGCAGLAWCALSAYYEFEMSKKYLRLKSNKK